MAAAIHGSQSTPGWKCGASFVPRPKEETEATIRFCYNYFTRGKVYYLLPNGSRNLLVSPIPDPLTIKIRSYGGITNFENSPKQFCTISVALFNEASDPKEEPTLYTLFFCERFFNSKEIFPIVSRESSHNGINPKSWQILDIDPRRSENPLIINRAEGPLDPTPLGMVQAYLDEAYCSLRKIAASLLFETGKIDRYHKVKETYGEVHGKVHGKVDEESQMLQQLGKFLEIKPYVTPLEEVPDQQLLLYRIEINTKILLLQDLGRLKFVKLDKILQVQLQQIISLLQTREKELEKRFTDSCTFQLPLLTAIEDTDQHINQFLHASSPVFSALFEGYMKYHIEFGKLELVKKFIGPIIRELFIALRTNPCKEEFAFTTYIFLLSKIRIGGFSKYCETIAIQLTLTQKKELIRAIEQGYFEVFENCLTLRDVENGLVDMRTDGDQALQIIRLKKMRASIPEPNCRLM